MSGRGGRTRTGRDSQVQRRKHRGVGADEAAEKGTIAATAGHAAAAMAAGNITIPAFTADARHLGDVLIHQCGIALMRIGVRVRAGDCRVRRCEHCQRVAADRTQA
ncbi:hypothetical protein D9M72_638040 [compost metagenome]